MLETEASQLCTFFCFFLLCCGRQRASQLSCSLTHSALVFAVFLLFIGCLVGDAGDRGLHSSVLQFDRGARSLTEVPEV